MDVSPTPLLRIATEIANIVNKVNGRALVVGGFVRDAFLCEVSKDLDIEVYGLTEEQLLAALTPKFSLDLVGRAFGIFKVKGYPIDISLPRRERKTGSKHTDFDVTVDPFLTVKEAAERRDFTMNAISFDPLTREYIDPFNGLADIKQGRLHPTSERFKEDPLRVLRGMQFISRFNLYPSALTLEYSQELSQEGLASERLFEEWNKMILRGKDIHGGLLYLAVTGWIRFYPELQAMGTCQQDPVWHPEGSVWVHTCHCMNAFAEDKSGYTDEENLVIGYATLLHDAGKPKVTEFRDGHWRAHAHNAAGVEPARAFMLRLTNQEDLIKQVTEYVREHMSADDIFDHSKSDNAVRRLATRVNSLQQLGRVMRYDKRGRPPIDSTVCPSVDWLYERAEILRVANEKPKPLVKGRHLIELGRTPGKDFGPILDDLFEMQLDGKFSTLEEGLVELKKKLNVCQS